MVSESVRQAGGEFGIAEDLYPFTEGAIGGGLLAHCTIGRYVTFLYLYRFLPRFECKRMLHGRPSKIPSEIWERSAAAWYDMNELSI